MGKTKDLIKNTGIIALGNFGTKVISFLLLPLYTTLLSASEYGEFDFLVVVTQFLVPFITLLMEEGMFRFLIDAEDERQKKQVISQAAIYIVISTALFSFLIYLVVKFIHYNYLNYLIAYIIASVMLNLALCLARGLGRIKLYSFAGFLSNTVYISLNIIFIVVLGLKVKGLLSSFIISGLLVSFYVFARLKLHRYFSFKDFDFKLMRKMLGYTFPLVPNSISWAVINFSDRLVITSFFGTGANGIYSVANKFPSLIDNIYGFFYTSWKEAAAKAIKERDSEEFYNFINTILNKFLMTMTIGVIALLPFLFNILVNENYNEAYKYIPLLVLSMFFANMSGFYGGIFSAYKKTKVMGTTTILSAVIKFLACLLLIVPLGLFAGVISTLLSNIAVYFYRRIKIAEYVKLSLNVNFIVFSTVVSLIVFCCYYSENIIVESLSLTLAVVYALAINKEIVGHLSGLLIRRINARLN